MPFIVTSLWYLPGYTFEFIKAASDVLFDVINAVYHDKPLKFTGLYVWIYQGCFWHFIWRDKCRLSWQAFDIGLPSSGSEYKSLNMFEFIKAVSGTVFDMIKIAVYHEKHFILNLFYLFLEIQ